MTHPDPLRRWVSTASLEQVLLGVAGGFVQADGGREARLRVLRRGDPIVFYSPRLAPGSTTTVQQLTALGEVADDEPYQVEGGGGARPWRRRVDFEEVGRVPIRPLIAMLGFVTDEQRWGLPFRSGLLEVTAGDFGVLAGAMRDAVTHAG